MASLRARRVSRCEFGLIDDEPGNYLDRPCPSGVDLDDPPVAGLGDHRPAIGQALEGVDLDSCPLVRGPRGREVCFQADLLVEASSRRPFTLSVVHQDVAVGEDLDVVRGVAERDLPLDLALGTDDRELALVLDTSR